MIVDDFEDEERVTRPTQPPTINDLIQALTETNELMIDVRGELRMFAESLRAFRQSTEERLDNLERVAAE